MTKLIRRLLGLLFTLGIYTKHYKISYTGKLISWNILYSQGHWAKRSALKSQYEKLFTILALEAQVKKMEEMSIVAFYNNKMDVDNISLTTKWLADVLKGTYIEGDDTRFYKGLMIFHDEALPKNNIELHIIGK